MMVLCCSQLDKNRINVVSNSLESNLRDFIKKDNIDCNRTTSLLFTCKMEQKRLCLMPISIEELEGTIRKIITDSLRENLNSSPSKSDGDFLTRNETAQLLRVTLPTLYDWTKRGYLISYRMGSRIRYKRSEVNEAFDSGQLQKYGRAV
jgi:excisionase family DNA binding protein